MFHEATKIEKDSVTERYGTELKIKIEPMLFIRSNKDSNVILCLMMQTTLKGCCKRVFPYGPWRIRCMPSLSVLRFFPATSSTDNTRIRVLLDGSGPHIPSHSILISVVPPPTHPTHLRSLSLHPNHPASPPSVPSS